MFETDERTRAARTALAYYTRHGIDLPDRTAAAVEDAARARDMLTELQTEGGPDALADMFGALIDGTTKPDPAQLTRTVLAAMLADRPAVTQRLTARRDAALVAAMREDGPHLVEALRPTFEAAAADLEAAASVLVGVDDLEDLQAVANVGGDAAAAWKSAKAAEASVLALEAALTQLSVAGCYHRTGDGRERRLAILDADFEGYRHVKLQTRPWQLRKLGTLSLATADELAARIARVDAEWAKHPDNPATRIGPGAGQFPVGREPRPQMIGGAL